VKFARFGQLGSERPAIVDANGRLRDASGLVSDIDVASIQSLIGVNPESLPLVEGPVRLGVPFTGTRKFFGIGLNYADHARETGAQIPEEPVVFTKAITCLSGPDDAVPMPLGSQHMDWEVELGVVIGKTARYVSEAEALDHVAGFVLVNDVSERFDQKERGGSWDKGKGHDGFGPVGPWLVSQDELGDGRNIDLFLDVSGVSRQRGTTNDMIFTVPQIVAYLSRFFTLEPGDIVATGTPAGVGAGTKPGPQFLNIGDEMHLRATGLGEQRQRVIANPNEVSA
jgi:2,4-didehydro-3-deoxy-L-rhamnonate hydrolase